MDNLKTFLEYPLDRELYTPKRILRHEKPPLRVLITEAGTKIAHHLMYKICSGVVFGPDQPIILHLVNSKGTINHKSALNDLEQCGFPSFADYVVSAEPEISYENVDVVILISVFEDLSGHNTCNSFLCHLNRIWNVVRNTKLYAKPNVKLVVCNPSTKGVIVSLYCIKKLEPNFISENLTGVVLLDETLSKNLLAAQLRTTTDKIRNIVIWGATAPDLRNATVFMYPPNDKSQLEKVEVPVSLVLEDEKWIYSDLIPSIYCRLLSPELVKNGGALASAVARHLKLLYQGSKGQEIASMAVIVPDKQPFGLKKNTGFSLPVETKNGCVEILEHIEFDNSTHLMNLRSMYNIEFDPSVPMIDDMISYIKYIEETTQKKFVWNEHTHTGTKWDYLSSHYLRHIMSPNYEEAISMDDKDVKNKKSITWEEVAIAYNSKSTKTTKSSLRFNLLNNSSNFK